MKTKSYINRLDVTDNSAVSKAEKNPITWTSFRLFIVLVRHSLFSVFKLLNNFLCQLISQRKEAISLNYFVDHKKKRIHKKQYAGDRCGFVGTPADKREFIDCEKYIEQLEKQEAYEKCPYCQSIQLTVTRHPGVQA